MRELLFVLPIFLTYHYGQPGAQFLNFPLFYAFIIVRKFCVFFPLTFIILFIHVPYGPLKCDKCWIVDNFNSQFLSLILMM